MLVRFAQIAITVFWLVMTTLLFRLVFFPEETRLAEVPPQLVLERFLGRRAPSNLLILDGNREVGSVTISPGRINETERRKAIELGRPGEAAAIELSLAGMVNVPALAPPGQGDRNAGRMRFTGRVWLGFDHELAFVLFEAQLPGVPDPLTLEVHPQAERTVLRRGKEVLLDTAGGAEVSELNAQATLLMSAWGLQMPDGLEGLADEDGVSPPSIIAREGLVTIGGHRFSAYLLDLPLPWGGELRFVLTKAGELMRIDGLLAYQIIVDDFAPVTPQSALTAPPPQ